MKDAEKSATDAEKKKSKGEKDAKDAKDKTKGLSKDNLKKALEKANEAAANLKKLSEKAKRLNKVRLMKKKLVQ